MAISVEVPSLQERALTDLGMKILRRLQLLEESLMWPVHHYDIIGSVSRCEYITRDTIKALIEAGFMSAVPVGSDLKSVSEKVSYALTDAGWEIVGGKPIWME